MDMTNDEGSVARFSEVYQKGRPYPTAMAVGLDDIIGKPVIIEEYVLRPSRFPDRQMAIIHGHSSEVNPEAPHDFSVATGSAVVLRQLEETKGLLPYRATFAKFKNYYKLV